MDSEKSIFDPNVKVEQPKVELKKVEQPKVELKKVEQPTVELKKVELKKIEQPKVELKKVEQPKVELKKVELKKVDQPNNTTSTVLTRSDKSFIDEIINYIENFSIDDMKTEHIVIIILICCVLGYGIYYYLDKEGFVNPFEKQNIYFKDIDIYYINLDTDKKKRFEFEKQYKDQGLQITRYEAIGGDIITDEVIEEILGNPRSRDFKNSVLVDKRKNIGQLGKFLSHIGVYQEFMESDKPYCLIFEDDAEFKTNNFKKDVNMHMGNIPSDWDIILFGYHTGDDLQSGGNQNTFLRNNIFYNMEHWIGTHAYLINRRSCEKMLEKLVNPEWYLDWAISSLVREHQFNVYGVFKPLVCQPACNTVNFDNPQLKMNYIQNCKHRNISKNN